MVYLIVRVVYLIVRVLTCDQTVAWAPVGADCAGTRCGDLLGRYQLLNRRMQEETRGTFEDFEASMDRDSARHTVGSPRPAPASCC